MDDKFRSIALIIWEDGRHNMARGDETFDDYWERKRDKIVLKMMEASKPPLDPEHKKWLEKMGKILNELSKIRKEKNDMV